MSVISARGSSSYSVQTTFFDLNICQEAQHLTIDMMVLSSAFSTNSFPQTASILQEYYPAVLRSDCFNDHNLPFYIEVQNTEIGHLFEHILLTYLCELKIASGEEDVMYNGVTKWNWKRDKKGVFHIKVDAGDKDKDILPHALNKSIQLLTRIMTSSLNSHATTKQTAN